LAIIIWETDSSPGQFPSDILPYSVRLGIEIGLVELKLGLVGLVLGLRLELGSGLWFGTLG